jgi:hypothetical protein
MEDHDLQPADCPVSARKVGGSYQAVGWIVSMFQTRDGHWRYVFEFDEPHGMLHIFSSNQLEVWPSAGRTSNDVV